MFIKLTDEYGYSLFIKKEWLLNNLLYISVLYEDNDPYSKIGDSEGKYFIVLEKPEEIIKLITDNDNEIFSEGIKNILEEEC